MARSRSPPTPEQSNGACFFHASNISWEARTNRTLLADVLTAAGLVNYPTDWWHWSFGDRYWAFIENQAQAIYGPAESEAGLAFGKISVY